jgi:hypothetical protein
MQYHETFSDLAGIYLEDSWVLEVASSEHGLSFRIDAVLTPEHSRYEPPGPGEQHCYRTGWLSLRSATPMDIRLSGSPLAIDATGAPDFGHVDAFVLNRSEDRWELEGDWGQASVRNPEVTLRFD